MAEKKFVRYFNGRYFETFTKEQGSLFKRGYMINDNENEAENEKQITNIQHEQTQAKMWSQTY